MADQTVRETVRCAGHTKGGTRCKLNTTKYSAMCHLHTKQQKGLKNPKRRSRFVCPQGPASEYEGPLRSCTRLSLEAAVGRQVRARCACSVRTLQPCRNSVYRWTIDAEWPQSIREPSTCKEELKTDDWQEEGPPFCQPRLDQASDGRARGLY
jgi:hypothetical protein